MPDQLDQLDPVTGLPHHLHARPVEQTRQALPKKDVVVRQDHPQPADGPLVAITILTSPLLVRARHTVIIDQPGTRGPDATALAQIPASGKRGTAGNTRSGRPLAAMARRDPSARLSPWTGGPEGDDRDPARHPPECRRAGRPARRHATPYPPMGTDLRDRPPALGRHRRRHVHD